MKRHNIPVVFAGALTEAAFVCTAPTFNMESFTTKQAGKQQALLPDFGMPNFPEICETTGQEPTAPRQALVAAGSVAARRSDKKNGLAAASHAGSSTIAALVHNSFTDTVMAAAGAKTNSTDPKVQALVAAARAPEPPPEPLWKRTPSQRLLSAIRIEDRAVNAMVWAREAHSNAEFALLEARGVVDRARAAVVSAGKENRIAMEAQLPTLPRLRQTSPDIGDRRSCSGQCRPDNACLIMLACLALGGAALQHRTTNMAEMPWHVASQDDAAENFLGIHYMGKRAGKYMDVQRSSAPLLGPTACTSRSCYVPHSLDGCEGDREAAARMKDQACGPVAAAGAASPRSMLQSVYGSAFAPLTEHQTKSAKLKSLKPKGRTSPLATLDTLLETRSHAHESYPQRAPQPSVPWHSPTTLGPVARGPWRGEAERSIYQQEFGAPAGAPQRPRSTPLPSSRGSVRSRCATPGPSPPRAPAEAAARLERARRAEGLQLRQVFREDTSAPSGAASAASGRATPAASQATPR
ncbi:unnamed protein product [Prorocentrum cordatum]|uniref:Uncharacterized protein n=1 Tax=Prorocentrum cordatum TaxID=2364126 RepID=A0ABN9X1Z3_9DINO|nr:unnamed protein product [Polarella glacialis]